MGNTTQEPNLDILRSVAVLTVLITHTLQVIAGCKYGDRVAFGIETYALGRIGVLLFFVHTSLVLMKSLERTGRKLCGWALVRHFYVRRAFRIYPLSISVIVICIMFSIPPNALNVPYEWQGAKWAAANILLIQNITRVTAVSSPLWSLPYEVQMYLVLPLLYMSLRVPRSAARLSLIFISGAFLSLTLPLFRFVPCFLAGVVANAMVGIIRPWLPGWLWCPAVVSVVLFYVVDPKSDGSWLKDVLICMAVALLIPLFQRNTGTIAAAAAQIAKYSYGIYLCHTPVLWLLYRKLPIFDDSLRLICVPVMTGTAAIVCYHAVERPCIEIGGRIGDRLSNGCLPAVR